MRGTPMKRLISAKVVFASATGLIAAGCFASLQWQRYAEQKRKEDFDFVRSSIDGALRVEQPYIIHTASVEYDWLMGYRFQATFSLKETPKNLHQVFDKQFAMSKATRSGPEWELQSGDLNCKIVYKPESQKFFIEESV